jgi:hypothetical protein
LIAAAINFPLFFLFCIPGELRNLSMLYVPILFLMLANLEAWQRSPGPQAAVQSVECAEASLLPSPISMDSRQAAE